MKKAGILCASDTELAPFLRTMDIHRITEKAMLKFYEGTLRQVPDTAVYSGVVKLTGSPSASVRVPVDRPEEKLPSSSSVTVSPLFVPLTTLTLGSL